MNIRLDYFQNYVQIDRFDWMNQIGILGGIAGFYSGIVAIIVGYFAEFDYLTAFIKRLFLEEETDERFYAKYLREDWDQKKNRKCCAGIFDDEVGEVNQADLEEYQKVR